MQIDRNSIMTCINFLKENQKPISFILMTQVG
jgi:hypothetical protein